MSPLPIFAIPPSASVGGSENARTTAWVNAVVAAGGTVSAGRRTIVNTLQNGLDTDGLPAKVPYLWHFAAENSQSALIDYISLAAATVVNSPTFTADQGYAGNGTSSYVNLGKNTAGTQNASAFGFYNRSNSGAIAGVEMGSSISGAAVDFNCNVSVNYDGNLYFALNDANGDAGRTAPVNVSGIYVNSRTSSTICTIYRAGSSFATNGQTSTGVPTFNYCVGCAFDKTGAAAQFVNRQIGMAFLANTGLTGTEAANLTTRIQTYMTAVGA